MTLLSHPSKLAVMFNSEHFEQFATGLAEHRPPVIFSPMGNHPVEYMDGTDGPVAIISQTLPEGVSVRLDNGTLGTMNAVVVSLPEGDE